MKMNQCSSLLCIHTDLDGISNFILAQNFDLHFDKVVSYDYGFEENAELVRPLYDSDNIVIADLSITPALYNELIAKGKTVQIFDHHETSRWIFEKAGCVWDGGRSGTKIFFDAYIKPRVKRYRLAVREFVDLVDVYDRWDLSSPLRPASEDLQRVFVKYGNWDLEDALVRHDRFITAMLRKLQKDEHFQWNNVELMYIRDAKTSEDKAYDEAVAMLQIRRDNRGRKFGLFSAWGKISMTCHRMLSVDNMDVDYLICAQTFHNKLGAMSFRAREGQFDLTELAGVNGHKASAGATLAPEDVKRFMRENLCFRYKSDLKDADGPITEPVIEIF
jgi:oligoribonuclease NrnB/cAMP/cGMP phosphodiesterase (DHH superfamily)